jgi:hypothetical protein
MIWCGSNHVIQFTIENALPRDSKIRRLEDQKMNWFVFRVLGFLFWVWGLEKLKSQFLTVFHSKFTEYFKTTNYEILVINPVHTSLVKSDILNLRLWWILNSKTLNRKCVIQISTICPPINHCPSLTIIWDFNNPRSQMMTIRSAIVRSNWIMSWNNSNQFLEIISNRLIWFICRLKIWIGFQISNILRWINCLTRANSVSKNSHNYTIMNIPMISSS